MHLCLYSVELFYDAFRVSNLSHGGEGFWLWFCFFKEYIVCAQCFCLSIILAAFMILVFLVLLQFLQICG